ncbi:MAG: hypothetical protein ACKVYV_16240 [Limisphaerales bacterium]
MRALLTALLVWPSAAQEGGDRINFSKPTDKVNKVDQQRPRIDGARRDMDLSGGSLGGDSVSAPAAAQPTLTRGQLDALKKLQADRDWALQDFRTEDEHGSSGPGFGDSGRMAIDDLFDRSRAGKPDARAPARDATGGDNSDASLSPRTSDRTTARPFEAANDFSPRARSILDGETLFEKQKKKGQQGILGHGGPNDLGALTSTAKTPAERRSEQRMLDFRKMLNTSAFDPDSRGTDGAPSLTGAATPGLNSQLNQANPRRGDRSGTLADDGPARAREDVFLGGTGVSALRPRSSTLPDLGREASGLDATRRTETDLGPRDRPAMTIPKFEVPRRNF